MADTGLPMRLMEITNPNDALKFVQAQGLLGYAQLQGHPETPGDPVNFILERAQETRETFDLLARIQEGETETFSLRSGHGVYFFSPADAWRLIPSLIDLSGIFLTLQLDTQEPVPYQRVPELSTDPIGETIAYPSYSRTPPVGVRVEFRWRCLLDVINWHIAYFATGERRLGRCEECGSYFDRTDARQRFCPPEGESQQSRCGARNRARRNRQQGRKGT